ncbi:MAG TPA: hypothetical protein VIH53_09110 [Gemmatimonadaceae bacterium]
MRCFRLLTGIAAAGLSACAPAKREAPPRIPDATPRAADATSRGDRSYFMGFSIVPPRFNDVALAIRSAEIWTRRSDAAIMHLDVPWAMLLAGSSPADALRKDGVDLEHYYRSKRLRLVVTIDVTNGLARDKEAEALVAAHRSITEPAVQQLYRNYVRTLVEMLHPDYLGLAAETNLIRLTAPRSIYSAVVRMTNDAASDIRRSHSAATLPLYVSVQVETAWGRLGVFAEPRPFAGIDQDVRDFPFINVLGLSSYPYLGGFKNPDDIPLDYYTRLRGTRTLPLMVVEGGWATMSVGGVFSTSTEMQAQYIARQSRLLDEAKAIGVFQLSFTDLDLRTWRKPVPGILVMFMTLGLVDAALNPKPALDVWDRIFARRLTH